MTTIGKFAIDGGNGTDLAGEDSNSRRFEATTKRDGLSTNDRPAGIGARAELSAAIGTYADMGAQSRADRLRQRIGKLVASG